MLGQLGTLEASRTTGNLQPWGKLPLGSGTVLPAVVMSTSESVLPASVAPPEAHSLIGVTLLPRAAPLSDTHMGAFTQESSDAASLLVPPAMSSCPVSARH